MNAEKFAAKVRAEVPEPGTTAVEHLLHTVAAHKDSRGDQVVVEATSNIFGRGVRTGLTLDDLRELAEKVRKAGIR